MATRGIVGPDPEVKRGRYLHWDAYPSWMGTTLVRLVQRDGVERVREVLTSEHFGWSSVNDHVEHVMPEHYSAERFVQVPGYGTAYVNHTEQPDVWHVEGDTDWLEYAYLLGSEHLLVYSISHTGSWRLLTKVRYDDPAAETTLYALS